MKYHSITHYFLFILTILWALPSLAKRDVLATTYNIELIQQQLQQNQSWVSYPAYTDRQAWQMLLGSNAEMLIKKGERRLNYKWKLSLATDYLAFQRTGDRNIMQVPQGDNNAALSDLVLAELAEGKGRFIDQIVNGLFLHCERTSWVLSAHLHRQSTRRVLPDFREQIIDLVSGEIGAFVSWCHYFFQEEFDKIDPMISARLRYEIEHRILTPFFANEREWWVALHLKDTDMVNNWNPWCNFNVLQCFLLMEQNPERLAKAVYRSMLSVDKFINYVKEDGACEEGPAYWGHAAGKLYDYLELLNIATKGKVAIFDNAQVRGMGEYISRSYVANGWVVNFADASAKYTDNIAPLVYSYGEAIKSDELKAFGAYLGQQGKSNIATGTDIYRALRAIRLDDELKRASTMRKTPAVTWYPQTEFCYMTRGDWFLGVKGGYNEESHNHNDAGTFVLYYKGIPMLIDAGVGTYTKQTFSGSRYSIWTMQSQYHNLPTINGVQQQNGRSYKAKLINYNEKKQKISFDIAGAYPTKAAVKSWVRSYELTKSGLQLSDEAQLAETLEPHILNFMVWGDIDLSTPGQVAITVQNETVRLTYDEKQFDVTLEDIPQTDVRLSNVWGKVIYRIQLKQKHVAPYLTHRVTIR